MSIAFSEASGARIEAARQAGVANAARQADLSIWGVYLQARAQGETALAAYVEQRFTDHFRVAYNAWHAQGEPTSGPFKMKEYVPPGTTESAAADQQADSRFADALKFNQRGDNYTILTVLFALVLFFAAASTRLGSPRAQWILLGVAIVFLIIATVVLAHLPDRCLICARRVRGPDTGRLVPPRVHRTDQTQGRLKSKEARDVTTAAPMLIARRWRSRRSAAIAGDHLRRTPPGRPDHDPHCLVGEQPSGP